MTVITNEDKRIIMFVIRTYWPSLILSYVTTLVVIILINIFNLISIMVMRLW